MSASSLSTMGGLRRLGRYAWPHRLRLGTGSACLLVGGALGLVYPKLFGSMIDAAFTSQDVAALNRNTVALVAIFALQAVFVFCRHYLFNWVGERVVADLRVELYRHLVRLSQAFFQTKRTGMLLSRLAADVSKVQDMMSGVLSEATVNLVTLVGGIAILFWSNAYLTSVMLLVVPPLVVVTVFVGRRIREMGRRAQDEVGRANGELQEGIAGIETVQCFGREEHVVSQYADAIEASFWLSIKRVIAGSCFASGSVFAAFSAAAGVFWIGAAMVARAEITAGALTEFTLYTMLVTAAVAPTAALWSHIQNAIGATSRVFEILDTPRDIGSSPQARRLANVRGDVRFEAASFRYPGREALVLRDIDLHIRPGESCALVGASGSGKTTLARLVMRLYDPTQGCVRLDGHDLREVDLADLRGSMAPVSQEPVLFSGTIADNIRFGRLDATQAEVIEAARKANADPFIREFPDGYATRVGERGAQLSGGQRQRISIARAILRDPSVLILDEATSALDAHSEGLVQDALERLQRGRTTIIIAHRLSTIAGADRVVVLDDGRIVEEGQHAALLTRRGPYAHLVARQRTG